MTSQIIYKGALRTDAEHLQSGSHIETDAPIDNEGKGERFSPTDTVCLGFATCIITTMGIKAQDMNIELAGTTIDVQKHMAADPRRIRQIDVTLHFPKTLNLSEKDIAILERTGNNCPVAKSLHPDIVQQIVYEW